MTTNAAGVQPQATQDFDQLKTRLKTTWKSGDYDRFSRYLEDGAEQFYRRVGVKPGAQLLDVACGAGQLALIAAREGAQATGCDIAENWLEKARQRASAEGLNVRFEVGDAEELPYADAQFDAVTSVFGAMFAPRPDRVAAELTRVCRPGGVIAMVNWTPGGFVGRMFKTIARYIAPSGMPSPVLWGDETTVRDRLREGIAELRLERRIYHFDYPFAPEAVVEFFRENYGPMTRAFASLDAKEQNALRSEIVHLWREHNYSAEENRTKVNAEYLEVTAMRVSGAAKTGATYKLEDNKEDTMSRRAELLAARIEEGAAGLAAFVETITDEEWKKPLLGRDNRTVGVIVHHVATVYPIEVGAAQKIAKGEPITEITWEAVAQMNAGHAGDNAKATKSEALALLRRNSRAAADAVREFTDEELDRAAPFSLSFGAPVTAQFVIEDHALRHSWHHLAGIRKALGR